MTDSKRLVVVSNRLPVAIYQDGEAWQIRPSPGGLVTALTPTMQEARGLWIGWPGCTTDAPARDLVGQLEGIAYDLEPVLLTQKEIDRFYAGLANKTLWPLFHDLLGHFSFNTENWITYTEVNRKFAEAIARCIKPDDFIWIHDYHLLLVARFLREMGIKQRLSFFLHIPFPSPDVYRRLPVNREVLEALLEFDHVGFQTARDRRNFVQCVKWYAPEWRRTSYKRQSSISHGDREIKVGYYPISIDFNEFNNLASDQRVGEAAWYLHENMRSDVLMLGLDRLDYTKGIPERFKAFERALEKYEDMRGKISLVQVVVPSRLDVSEYQDLKNELDSLSGRINGRFTQHGWIPIHYMFRSLDRVQLVGHYKACEVALITPLRDGMNLVAKEYCASQIDLKGVLILSEFAGAAGQLGKGAIIVNPFDIESTADAIYQAYVMDPGERARRMQILRNEVKRNDTQRWVRWFLGDEELAVAPDPHVEATRSS
jgi:trehalose 6-phosphate synthase/phosphatase